MNHRRDALVDVQVSGQHRRALIPCVIDTGYSGALVLSERLVRDLGLAYAGSVRARLADGSLVVLPRYETEITWMGGVRAVLASAVSADNVLADTALLDGLRLSIDYAVDSVEVS